MPPLLVGLYILKYGVDVPYLDEWDTPGNDFVQLIAGDFHWRSLVAQHNEHRPFFPRLIFFGLAQLGSWNVKSQMFVSLLWGCLTYWNIYRLFEYTTDARVKLAKWLGLFSAGLLIFAFSQRENWLWGLQLATFMPFLVVSFCTALAYSRLQSSVKLLGAASACTIATFSFANGLLTWIVLPPVLLLSELNTHKQLKRTTAFLAAWLGIFFLNVWLYFRNYVRPGHHPTYTYAVQHPLETLAYFFSWLGGPMGKWLDFEGRVAIGILSFLVFVSVLLLCYRYSRNLADFFYQTIGWQTFAAYAIVSGTITTLGRVGFGIEQSLSGRYVTFATPFYISLVGLLVVLVGLIKRSQLASEQHHFPSERLLKNTFFCIATIALISFTLSSIPGFRWGYVSQLERYQGKTCLIFLNQIVDQQCIENSLYPNYSLLASKAELLINAGTLNIPRLETQFPADLTMADNSFSPIGSFIQLVSSIPSPISHDDTAADNSAQPPQESVALGWVKRSRHNTQPDAVILAYRDPELQRDVGFKVAGLTPKFAHRSFTAEVMNLVPDMPNDSLLWTVTFSSSELPDSACELSAWAFDIDRANTWPLKGNFSQCN